ncbi:hypothetical protein [Streptosporangium sp. KLBMP 9127]|nr:hypothetical protein [Streptosporangium sp. KLBMP 9127]
MLREAIIAIPDTVQATHIREHPTHVKGHFLLSEVAFFWCRTAAKYSH